MKKQEFHLLIAEEYYSEIFNAVFVAELENNSTYSPLMENFGPIITIWVKIGSKYRKYRILTIFDGDVLSIAEEYHSELFNAVFVA